MGRPIVQSAMKDSMKAECSDKLSMGAYALIFANNQKMTAVSHTLEQSINHMKNQKPLVNLGNDSKIL